MWALMISDGQMFGEGGGQPSYTSLTRTRPRAHCAATGRTQQPQQPRRRGFRLCDDSYPSRAAERVVKYRVELTDIHRVE